VEHTNNTQGVTGMLGELSSSFVDMDPATRDRLWKLLEARGAYLEATTELNRRRMIVLADPTPEGERNLADYTSTILAPLRAKMAEKMGEVITGAIDIDGIKETLPMLLSALAGKVDVTAVLTALGVDPDAVASSINAVSKYLKSNM
jgi:hypothetical protein